MYKYVHIYIYIFKYVYIYVYAMMFVTVWELHCFFGWSTVHQVLHRSIDQIFSFSFHNIWRTSTWERFVSQHEAFLLLPAPIFLQSVPLFSSFDVDPKAIQQIDFAGQLKKLDVNGNATDAGTDQPMLVLTNLEKN